MRHLIYALLGLFGILMVVSMATEKPRQYRAAKSSEKVESLPAETSPRSDSPVHLRPAPSPSAATTVKPFAAPNPMATALAYSRNDVGGKIVITTANCEKNTGLNAYTTHPDGAIDFGCWSADELYILINWDKAGLQNYSYERFYAVKTNERLVATALLDLAREPLSRFANKSAPSPTRKP